MQEFTTKAARHEFTIDGELYWLPGVTVADFEALERLSKLEGKEQIREFTALLMARVEPNSWWRVITLKSARHMVGRLTPAQLTDLYRAWWGMTPGESSGS
jgi:hypothetical protein